MADLSPVPPAVPQQQPLSPVPPRRPSLDDVVFGAFGMDPSLKRATLLPAAMNAAGEREWAVPQAFEERPPYPSENEYFKANPHVGGMAAEDGRVVLNPFSSLTAAEKKAVAMNEGARLLMRGGSVPRPDFSLTPDQADFFATINKGSPYGSEQDIRETIAARILSGDQSAGNVTPEQVEYVRRHLGSALPHPGADRRSNSR